MLSVFVLHTITEYYNILLKLSALGLLTRSDELGLFLLIF